MYAAKSQLFQRINECLQEINDPYPGFMIGPSNSLDKTATSFLILDRGVDFWGPKSKIFVCMQRNHYFFRKLTNVSNKIFTFQWKSMDSQAGTPIEDPRSDPQILLTKQPLHYTFSIGVSISEAAKAKFRCMQRLFGGHLASPSTSEQLQINACIIETFILK